MAQQFNANVTHHWRRCKWYTSTDYFLIHVHTYIHTYIDTTHQYAGHTALSAADSSHLLNDESDCLQMNLQAVQLGRVHSARCNRRRHGNDVTVDRSERNVSGQECDHRWPACDTTMKQSTRCRPGHAVRSIKHPNIIHCRVNSAGDIYRAILKSVSQLYCGSLFWPVTRFHG